MGRRNVTALLALVALPLPLAGSGVAAPAPPTPVTRVALIADQEISAAARRVTLCTRRSPAVDCLRAEGRATAALAMRLDRLLGAARTPAAVTARRGVERIAAAAARLRSGYSRDVVAALGLGARLAARGAALERAAAVASPAAPSAPLAAPAPPAPVPPPAPPALPLAIAAEPPLEPGFARDVEDFTTRCRPGEGVRVSATAPPGTLVAIDGGPPGTVPLEAGQSFTVTVTDPAGTTEHTVRCLPPDFPTWTVGGDGATEAEFYVIAPSLGVGAEPYVAIVDPLGVPVWWMRRSGPPLDAKLLPDGRLAWTEFGGGANGPTGDAAYEFRGLRGELLGTASTVGTPTDGHDLQLTPGGDALLLSYRQRTGVDLTSIGGPADATVLDAEIQQVAPDGSLVWSWTSAGRVTPEETGQWIPQVLAAPFQLPGGGVAYDLVHVNSVEWDGDGVVFSARHLDAVYRVDRTTGDITWKLGGTPRPESLTVVGDPDAAGAFGGQHDARVLPDGTLTLQDNGTGDGRPPRAVRYAIDVAARTATLLEDVRDPLAPVSICCGSSRRLPGGNWVSSWGGAPVVSELRPDGGRAFTLTFPASGFPAVFSYRADPVLPGRLTRAALRAGMDAMHPRPGP